MRRSLLSFLALFGVGALVVAGCGASDFTAKPGAIEVVVATTQIGDFVREVGGDAVDVHQILQPNTDPHDYEPRPRTSLATAERSSSSPAATTSTTGWARSLQTRGLSRRWSTPAPGGPARCRGRSGAEASRYDPHWWHDPRNVEAAVR